jgi:hypothetical protein
VSYLRYSDPRSHNKTFLTGVGIVLAGNDHFITNSIVFSALIGVNISGAANLITGFHLSYTPLFLFLFIFYFYIPAAYFFYNEMISNVEN